MLDVYHLPSDKGISDVQIFVGDATVTNTQWKTWRKPRGKSMCHILAISSGAGSGGGFTAVATTARGGGGSGGSSGQTRVTIPLFLLPDVLYVQVAAGGIGTVSGGGTAGSGILSYVSVSPNTTANDCICISGAAAPTGGGTGTTGAVGAAGSAGSIAVIGSMPLAGAGQFAMIAGQAGVAGGAVAGANGTAQALPVTSCICVAGTGGAGTTSADFAGGAFTAVANSFISEQRPATPASGSNDGSTGVIVQKPLFLFGGGGGSASNAGVGGNGGNGAPGCSGGGGGGGTTAGKGGDGGPGLVIIVCW